MKQSFQDEFTKVNSRVDEMMVTQRRSRTPSPRRKEPETERSVARRKEPESSTRNKGAKPWSERTDTVHDLAPITDADWEIEPEDSEEPTTITKARLSEETSGLLSDAITSTLSNVGRREIRGKYPVPETDLTRTPKLDEIFTASESKFMKNGEAKTVEKDLLHITACSLDVTRPLIDLIEGVTSGELTPDEVKERAVDALILLGNSIAHTSQIRRRRVLKVCNPDISSLAENKELFVKAPPTTIRRGLRE